MTPKRFDVAQRAIRRNQRKSLRGRGVSLTAMPKILDPVTLAQRYATPDPPWRPIRRPVQNGRQLGVPDCEDRIAQRAAATALAHSVEWFMPDLVHGDRPGRGVPTAVASLRETVALVPGGTIVKADITKFFANIQHDVVLAALVEMVDEDFLSFIESFLAAQGERPGIGLPQGSPLSPVLANITMLLVTQDLQAVVSANRSALELSPQFSTPATPFTPRQYRGGELEDLQGDHPTAAYPPSHESPETGQGEEPLSLGVGSAPHRPADFYRTQVSPAPRTMIVGGVLYVDDLLLVIAGGRAEGAMALGYVGDRLRLLDLELSKDKSRVSPVQVPWSALGLVFHADRHGRLGVEPDRSARRKMKRKVAAAVSTLGRGTPVDDPDSGLEARLRWATAYYVHLGADLSFLDLPKRLVQAGLSTARARAVADRLLVPA